MFTGIIQSTGRVERRDPNGAGARLTVATPKPLPELGVGESIDDLAPFTARDFAQAIAGIGS